MKQLASFIFIMLFSVISWAEPCATGKSSTSDLKDISKNTCMETLKSQECQDLFAKMRANGEKPEDKALKCQDQNSISRAFESSWNYSSGCAIGGWNFVADTFVSIGTAIGEGAAKVVLDYQNTKAENAICDSDFQLKKNLFTEYNKTVPKLLRVDPPSDAILAKTNCASVKSVLKMNQIDKSNQVGRSISVKVMSKTPNFTADEQEYMEWGKAQLGPSVDLVGLAKDKLKEMGVKLQCYNSQQAAALVCEAIASVATLVAGPAGAALKAAKLSNIAKIAGVALDTEKATEAGTVVRAVAATATGGSENMRLASEASKMIKAGASKEDILKSVGKIDDALDGGKARLSLAEDALNRPLSSTEKDWVLKAHNKHSDKSYRIKKDGSSDELSVSNIRDKMQNRPSTISSRETRDLVENGILGSSTSSTDPLLRLQAQKSILGGLEKGSGSVVADGWKAGQQYYKKLDPAALHPDYRGVNDIMEANNFGLKTKESADLFEKFLAVNKADEKTNFKSMVGSLSGEIKRLEALKTQDVEATAYKVWRAKELRYELVERYYSKKYADKWGDIDIDKIGSRESAIRQKLYEELKKSREYAKKRNWPTSEELQ